MSRDNNLKQAEADLREAAKTDRADAEYERERAAEARHAGDMARAEHHDRNAWRADAEAAKTEPPRRSRPSDPDRLR